MKDKLLLPKSEVFEELIKLYPDTFSFSTGRVVRLNPTYEEGFAISSGGDEIAVNFQTTSDMFRALGTIMALKDEKEIELKKKPPLTFRGLMIDVSRNGVIKESYLEIIIVKLALLGINFLTLYTEDTFEVTGEPLIGYQRGKYSKAGIRRLVKFAKQFGIVMFPCIQTLGHVEQILKFPKYAGIADDNRIFNVEKKETYKLIEKLIKNGSEPYESKLIHIGMDETWGLGKGKTFNINKKMDPRMMYVKHLVKVNNICKKLKLKPIMWGDIIINMHGTGKMNKEHFKYLPKNIIMDYWNYYSNKASVYEETVKRYRKLGFEPLISPSLWNFSCFWGRFNLAESNMLLFIEKAKELKIKRCMMTMWGDDGAECPFDSNWPGLVLYAELCYEEKVNMEMVKKTVKAVAKDDWETFLAPAKIDFFDKKSSNLSKGFLYDDPLLGIYASQVRAGKSWNPYFEKIFKKIKGNMKKTAKENRILFKYAYALLDLLRIKADIKNIAYRAYQAGDKKKLRSVAATAGLIGKKTDILWKAHRAVWLMERKPFGLEVLDSRYAGLRGRCGVMEERIKDYLNGRISELAELEEKPERAFGEVPYFHINHDRAKTISAIK